MKKMILTSSGITESFKDDFFNRLGRYPKGLKLCLITTAAYPEIKREWLDPILDQLKGFGFEVELMDLEDESPDTLREKLSDFDVIYVNGGNTFKLLKYVRKSGFGEIIGDILEMGKIYVGVSAGSILVGPSIEGAGWEDLIPDENVVDLKDLTGINLVNLCVFPHFEKAYKEAIDKEARKVDYPIAAISEDQAVLVRDDRWEVVGEGERIVYNQ